MVFYVFPRVHYFYAFTLVGKENKAEVWCGLVSLMQYIFIYFYHDFQIAMHHLYVKGSLKSGAVVVIDTVSWNIVTVSRYPKRVVSANIIYCHSKRCHFMF